eukprot:m51a1_g6088 hypothetical protein (701) ;mRNA; r:23085-32308
MLPRCPVTALVVRSAASGACREVPVSAQTTIDKLKRDAVALLCPRGHCASDYVLRLDSDPALSSSRHQRGISLEIEYRRVLVALGVACSSPAAAEGSRECPSHSDISAGAPQSPVLLLVHRKSAQEPVLARTGSRWKKPPLETAPVLPKAPSSARMPSYAAPMAPVAPVSLAAPLAPLQPQGKGPSASSNAAPMSTVEAQARACAQLIPKPPAAAPQQQQQQQQAVQALQQPRGGVLKRRSQGAEGPAAEQQQQQQQQQAKKNVYCEIKPQPPPSPETPPPAPAAIDKEPPLALCVPVPEAPKMHAILALDSCERWPSPAVRQRPRARSASSSGSSSSSTYSSSASLSPASSIASDDSCSDSDDSSSVTSSASTSSSSLSSSSSSASSSSPSLAAAAELSPGLLSPAVVALGPPAGAALKVVVEDEAPVEHNPEQTTGTEESKSMPDTPPDDSQPSSLVSSRVDTPDDAGDACPVPRAGPAREARLREALMSYALADTSFVPGDVVKYKEGLAPCRPRLGPSGYGVVLAPPQCAEGAQAMSTGALPTLTVLVGVVSKGGSFLCATCDARRLERLRRQRDDEERALVQRMAVDLHVGAAQGRVLRAGDIVIWRSGMRNREAPRDAQPAVVIEVLPPGGCGCGCGCRGDAADGSAGGSGRSTGGDPGFREHADVRIGVLDKAGVLAIYARSSARLQLYHHRI